MMNYVIASIVLFQNSLGGGVKSTTINNYSRNQLKIRKKKKYFRIFFLKRTNSYSITRRFEDVAYLSVISDFPERRLSRQQNIAP